jgi:hypothetical protein
MPGTRPGMTVESVIQSDRNMLEGNGARILPSDSSNSGC